MNGLPDLLMRFKNSALGVFYFFFLISKVSAIAQSTNQVDWRSRDVAPGLVWKTAKAEINGALQHINILEIDLRKREVTLVYDSKQNRPTSEMASEAGGLAAVNAGFFDVKNGGSVTYLKVDGKQGEGDTAKWKSTANLNGALIIKRNGGFELELVKDYARYTQHKKYDDVLVTGLLLMDEGKILTLPDNAFVTNRHPRTCLGIVNKNKVLLVTVDGRAEEAAGMTLQELTMLMLSLNCKEAINLDGGGSTTMRLASESSGVVNMPSDNRKFDHLGERKVSNILVVK